MKTFIRKRLREQIIDGENMNTGLKKACDTMSVATYKEGLQLIINAIGTPQENPELWKRFEEPLRNWQQDDLNINKEKDTEHMTGDSMVDESNTWWTAIQSTICELGGSGLNENTDKIVFLRNTKYSNSGTKRHLPWDGIHAWAVRTSDLDKFFEQAYYQGSDKKDFIQISPQNVYAINFKIADDYVKGISDIAPKLEKFNPNKHVLKFKKLGGKPMYPYHSNLDYQILMNPTIRKTESPSN